MKKKLLTVLLLIILLLGFTGCGKKEQLKISNETKEKNYELKQINSDCNLENITFLNKDVIVAEGKVYLYADKKYSETDTHCKNAVTDNPNDNFVYLDNAHSSNYNHPESFTTDGNDFYYFDYDLNLKKQSDISNVSNILKNYRDNSFYYYSNGLEVTDKKIKYEYATEKDTYVNTPSDEKILYAIDYINGRGPFIITENNAYTLGVDKNDKCHEYEDVECTYVLKKTDIFDDLFKDFKNEIVYLSRDYLATKDNKMYKISFKLQ